MSEESRDKKVTKENMCFHASLEFASDLAGAEIVHGWIFNSKEWILHAWGEIDGVVYDFTKTRTPFDKNEYYDFFKIEEKRCRRYERIEYFTLVGDTGSVGPYDKELFFATSSTEDPLVVIAGKK
ncbi:MAG: hypothetical protein ACNI27_02990 [Desulfovibrio sp.]